MQEGFNPGDRVRLKERPTGDGVITKVILGGYGQQLMAEVLWDSGWHGGPFIRDLVRVDSDSSGATH